MYTYPDKHQHRRLGLQGKGCAMLVVPGLQDDVRHGDSLLVSGSDSGLGSSNGKPNRRNLPWNQANYTRIIIQVFYLFFRALPATSSCNKFVITKCMSCAFPGAAFYGLQQECCRARGRVRTPAAQQRREQIANSRESRFTKHTNPAARCSTEEKITKKNSATNINSAHRSLMWCGSQVLAGDWVEVDSLLGELEIPAADLTDCLFAARRQRYLELLEANKTQEAITFLQAQITPLKKVKIPRVCVPPTHSLGPRANPRIEPTKHMSCFFVFFRHS
jgi:hypothetical protein